ncbi:MAG: response regulator, partial [Ignavibacteriae bacterium]|nr:response regulator [Ignavibacteriota bacterium]
MRVGIINNTTDEVFWRKDGTSFPVEYTSTPIREGETIVGVVVVFTDITARKNMENQLRQAQKMESIGTLAGGIAHDFNNILGIIMGHASLLERNPGDAEQIVKRLQAINKASQRGASLVKQLLTFARKTEARFEPVQLNDTVLEVRKLLSETLPKAITITTKTDATLPHIHADSSQLHQVLVNLCVNARDAMPTGGTLEIVTEVVAGETLRQRIPKATVMAYIHLSVSDTGIGMDKETQTRIFEPFFTTKEIGKGTGLGLASVYGIVENHHGFIRVESEVGKGTTFHLYFPSYHAEPIMMEPKPQIVPVFMQGTETILVAEDEELLRTLLEQLLSGQGFTVLSAQDGAEALSLYARHQKNISLVISDVGMPKLSGIELITALKAINPEVKVIISSGYLDTKLSEDIQRVGAKDSIMKPYSISEILMKVRQALDKLQDEMYFAYMVEMKTTYSLMGDSKNTKTVIPNPRLRWGEEYLISLKTEIPPSTLVVGMASSVFGTPG